VINLLQEKVSSIKTPLAVLLNELRGMVGDQYCALVFFFLLIELLDVLFCPFKGVLAIEFF
jgi:hypothetical protein